MYRKWLAYLGIPAVALAAGMLLTANASAQRMSGRGIGIGNSGLGIGPGYGYGSGFGTANPYYGTGFGNGYNAPGYGGFNNGYYGSNYYSPGWNGYPNNYGYSYPNRGYTYTQPGYVNQPGYVYGGQYVRPNQTAFYSGAQPNVNVPQGAALITVHVPPDAQLWFEDHQTQQQGPFRQFVTPQLDPNQTFSYTVRARWNQNGQPVDRSKKVSVHSGERATVDFMRDMGNDGNALPTGTVAPADRTNINPGTDNLNRPNDNLNRTTNPLPTNPGGTSGTNNNNNPLPPATPQNPGTNR